VTRRWPFALLALLLCGFTLYTFDAQTARVRWFSEYKGATYTTAAAESADFSHCFNVKGYGELFGQAYFRTAGLQCSWGVAGTGGTVGVVAQLVHEDGGIDCRCTLGACTATAASEVSCTCLDGGYGTSYGVELGKTIMPDGGEQVTTKECVQLSSLTDCAGNPQSVSCSVDLFR
jgi:hypothetical protein